MAYTLMHADERMLDGQDLLYGFALTCEASALSDALAFVISTEINADYGEGDMEGAVGDGETEGEPEGDVVEGEAEGDVECDVAGPEEITSLTPI
jgi:hypothetical protein